MAGEYKLTVGLEVHAELHTESKMFCGCKNDPEEKRPNWNVCPICMAHPGTLPVINRRAVEHVLRVGKALGGTIADFTEFDRKNYFYPDIPKNYQISQYKYPLVTGGVLNGVQITRVHLEEDTARSSHDKGDYSLVDFNRAGVPLMELVTEPVIHDAETAGNFGRELQLLLQYLGASEANMEKGQMRVEANISVSNDPNKFGTKVEVKNINSFRAVERAIAYEMKRHIAVIEEGGTIIQETRGWNDAKQETFSQRKKESSHDYRYFPDPDLPKLKLSEVTDFDLNLPELPSEKRTRYAHDFGIKTEDIEQYVTDHELGVFFEKVVTVLANDKELVKLASNYITSDIVGLGTEVEHDALTHITPETFGELIIMAKKGEVSSRGAKDILKTMVIGGGSPRAIAEKEGLFQKSDEGALLAIIKDVIVNNEKAVGEYRAGKENAVQFLVGQGMKASKGSANPGVLRELFLKELGK